MPPATGLAWQWFHLVGVSAAFLAGYAAILAVLGEFRKENLRLFLDLLDPRKMGRYIYGELTRREIEQGNPSRPPASPCARPNTYIHKCTYT